MALRIPFTKKKLSVRVRFVDTFESPTPAEEILQEREGDPFVGIERLVLVMMNGVGDYLYATPAIRAFRQKYPDVEFCLAVCKNANNWNSPLTHDFAKRNPDIDSVYYFDGCSGVGSWHEYDWSDAKKAYEGEGTLYLPFFYSDDQAVHRVANCFHFFNMECVEESVPKPILNLFEGDYAKAREVLGSFEGSLDEYVFVHLDTRSSQYVYPHGQVLINGLADLGKRVVVLGTDREYENARTLAMSAYSIFEVSALLELCAHEASMVSVNSVFYPISSAVGMRNLGFYILDDSVDRFVYDNMAVVTASKPLGDGGQLRKYYIDERNAYKDERNLFNYTPEDILRAYRDFLDL